MIEFTTTQSQNPTPILPNGVAMPLMVSETDTGTYMLSPMACGGYTLLASGAPGPIVHRGWGEPEHCAPLRLADAMIAANRLHIQRSTPLQSGDHLPGMA